MRESSTSRLAALDGALAQRPDQPELLYLKASLLAELGRREEAQAVYMAVIALEPTHFGALNDLGTLLHKADFRTAARTAYAEAVRHHPNNPIGRINLANAFLANGEIKEAGTHYEAALSLSPGHPDAHQGLANLLQQTGDWDAAEAHRQESYKARDITALPYRGQGEPRRVLSLMSGVGGNVPTRFVLDDTIFANTILIVEAFKPGAPLPPHDVVFNTIGDADICGTALDAAEIVLAHTTAPVINPPGRIRGTDRASNAARLGKLEGVRAPRIVTARRSAIVAEAEAFGYPLLIRSPGYHTGQYFKRVKRAADLAAVLADLPGEALLLIEPLDARGADGQTRKYRVIMIGGALFPLHLAISKDWKVHYFTSDMVDRPDHRAEEAAFLADMPGVLGPRAMTALHGIAETLGLDYAGIDFGLGAEGELLLFESNATMVVNPISPEPIWDYRRPYVARILDAAQGMVRMKNA